MISSDEELAYVIKELRERTERNIKLLSHVYDKQHRQNLKYEIAKAKLRLVLLGEKL